MTNLSDKPKVGPEQNEKDHPNNQKDLTLWHPFVVKNVKEKTITLENSGAYFELPKKIVDFDVKLGDKIFLQVADEETKKQEQAKFAKKILNLILGNES